MARKAIRYQNYVDNPQTTQQKQCFSLFAKC